MILKATRSAEEGSYPAMSRVKALALRKKLFEDDGAGDIAIAFKLESHGVG